MRSRFDLCTLVQRGIANRARLGAIAGVFFGLVLILSAKPVHSFPPPGAPPMADPSQMSGIPRVDPGLGVGSVSVRCLFGDFQHPAVMATVLLDVIGSDDAVQKTLEGTTDEQGRVTFDGLSDHLGGVVVARTALGGVELKSQPMVLDGSGGTRVLLVAPAEAGGDQAPHGDAGMPEPGKPFAVKGRTPGTLRVGTFDLKAKSASSGVKVTLEIREPAPDAAAANPAKVPLLLESRAAETDDTGSVDFENLLDPGIPEGARMRVRATVREGGDELVSDDFTMPKDTAIAVVLVDGLPPGGLARPNSAAPSGPISRPQLPPPMATTRLGKGVVEVRVVDPQNRPVPGTAVAIVMMEQGGAEATVNGVTNDKGVALIDNVDVRPESIYLARATYSDAPFSSPLFQLTDTMGVSVSLRVFPTTSDRTRVRSALQWRILPMENDKAQVVQFYEVLVDGDAAYWPTGGMRIDGAVGMRNVQVHPDASRIIEPDGLAPWVKLIEPIPPGEVISLSTAYVMPHDGTLELDWVAPFPLIATAVVLEPGMSLLTDAAGPPETDPHGATSAGEPLTLIPIEARQYIGGPCVALAAVDPARRCPAALEGFSGSTVHAEIGGLPTRPTWMRRIALVAAGILIALVVLAIAILPRPRREDVLRDRKEHLLVEITDAAHRGDTSRVELLAHALETLERQLLVLEAAGESKTS